MNTAVSEAKKKNADIWKNSAKVQKTVFILAVLIPTFGAYVLFNLYPNILSVYYSFFEWDGMSQKLFVGLKNYVDMLNDQFVWQSLRNNLILILTVPIVTMLIAVTLADLLVNRDFKENSIYKILYFIPNVLSSVVIALIWVFVYDGQFGLLNSLLRVFGIHTNKYWLSEQKTALLAVAMAIVWSAIGFFVIVFMNAMTSIPKSIYESAVLDGAKNMTRLFRITLPLISGIIRVSVLYMIITLLKGFEIIMILTGGGPSGATDVIGLYMFGNAFGFGTSTGGVTIHRFGYASAIGILLFIILVASNLLIDKVFNKEPVEY